MSSYYYNSYYIFKCKELDCLKRISSFIPILVRRKKKKKEKKKKKMTESLGLKLKIPIGRDGVTRR